MPTLSHTCHAIGLAAGLAAGATFAETSGSDADAEDAMPATDTYQWLEDVTGEPALSWVRAQNAKSEAELAASADFKRLEDDVRDILDSDAKIPVVEKIGAHYYNFWKDKQHERGLWRRTTLAEYRKPHPQWETVLDIDALNAAEKRPDGAKWVWHGADCLRPAYTRCLIALSPGGSDADVTREFDLTTKEWVRDGFFRPEAKGGVSWIDRDTVYVFTDFGAGTMTPSGYPRIVKQWSRGTPLSAATLVYEGQPQDMYIAAQRDHTPGFQRDFVSRTIAFYNDELYLRDSDGRLAKVDVPNSAGKSVHGKWLALELREPYAADGHTYPAGSLIVTSFDDFMAGKGNFAALFTPDDHTSLAGFTWTKNTIVLNVMRDVRSELTSWRYSGLDRHAGVVGPDGWVGKPIKGVPTMGALSVSAVDADDSDAVWVTATDYLTPTTLAIAGVSGDAAPEVLKSNPQFFDASRHVIEQHFATSKDGTRVPYFLVRPKDAKSDGSTPTLLYGYGGFEVSMTPAYSGGVGKGWLEKGGAYAVANIRGGGEYGPRWHQAALKSNRHKAYEDFAAVAQDLIAKKITSREHLGIQGGSNGGLLMGNMLTQYPELFGAIVVQVPLLDMKRYSHLLAGASWMAEYGDPDTADWDFIRHFSPYHLFDPAKDYPPTLFMTSTKDDRVHPGHARKMAAKMLDAGKDVRYYENIEGGHGGAANNAQSAYMAALAYTFLWQQLSR